MKSIAAMTAIAIALCALPATAVAAKGRQVQCKLVVEGKTYISGPCAFETLDAEGSFTIAGKTRFAYVIVSGNTANATWNKNPKSLHAESPLGTLTRNGACWENAAAQICAR